MTNFQVYFPRRQSVLRTNFIPHFRLFLARSTTSCRLFLLASSPELYTFQYTWKQIFKLDFLKNETLYERYSSSYFSIKNRPVSTCSYRSVAFCTVPISKRNLNTFARYRIRREGNNVACGSTLKHGIPCVEFWCIEREQKSVVTGEGVHIARGACVAGERLLTVPLHLRLARSMCTRPMRNACLFANFQMRIDSSRVTAPISAPVA